MVPKLVCTLESPGAFKPLRGLSPSPRDCDLIGLGCDLGIAISKIPSDSCVQGDQAPLGWRMGLPSPTPSGTRLCPHRWPFPRGYDAQHATEWESLEVCNGVVSTFTLHKTCFLIAGYSSLTARKILSLHSLVS